jgi:Ser-tRNA(Ala) deacylase AlaX
MATSLLYLDDTYRLTAQGAVTAKDRDERGAFLVLDRTIFYPQGGGQQADKGYLIDSATQIPVIFVGFRDGDVLHYVPQTYYDAVAIGQMLDQRVEVKYRLDNARLHTGGHLISHVLETIEPSLVPVKGYHFRDGPYVEFINARSVNVNALLNQANEMITDAISLGRDIEALYSTFDEIKRIRPHLAPFIPQDKPTRIVSIGRYIPLPCGGTHIASLTQIGMVRLTKTKRAKENTRVSYELGDPEGLH